jgi:hypothetical protein
MTQTLTPQAFIAKWKPADLSERAACQEHFIDLCRMLGHPTPAEADPTGEQYTFERGVEKSEGGNGWADVWKRGFFGWEYKGKHKDLKAAYAQLQLYRESLENPPLLVVCDLNRFEVHTNFTGCAKRVYAFDLDSLAHPVNLGTLRKLFHDPQALRPEHTTEDITVEAAKTFATMIDGWRDRGITGQEAAHFAMKLLFCMFAEDIDLLPDRTFRSTIEGAKKDPTRLTSRLKSLFDCMASGGDYGPVSVPWFNGGLFKPNEAVPTLLSSDVDRLITLNAYDWASVEPSIFGTLFERTLDPAKRSQIGAHYTSREDILTLLEPVLMAPLRREWADIQRRAEELWPQLADKKKAAKARKELDKILRDFVERLAHVQVLDAACGSGNFLYVAITLLLDLEKEVIAKAATYGTTLLPQVRPTQLHGLEINTYAAELAQVVIWIGYLQWMHANGFVPPRDPILEPLTTIRNTDAILDLTDPDDPKETVWPAADAIVGNPPFLGSNEMRSKGLDNAYIEALHQIYRLPGKSDLCCYWFEKARRQLERGGSIRAGLLATQTIRHGHSRAVLDAIRRGFPIFFGVSNRPWKQDGADVNVSMVGFGRAKEEPILDGHPVAVIHADLTSAVDVTTAKVIPDNERRSFEGVQKGGPFDFEYEVIADLLSAPTPTGRPCSDVLRPRANGDRLFKRRAQLDWIVDFGKDAPEAEAATYEPVFETLRRAVEAERRDNPAAVNREKWWVHKCSRPELRVAVANLPRYVVTSRVAAHRVFVFLDAVVIPDSRLFVFADGSDEFLGIMSSRAHELWALRQGARHGDGGDGGRPTYNNVRCFETFPFPDGTSRQRAAIAAAAKDLDTLRTNWLNPREWTREEVLTFPGSVSGPWARYVTQPNANGIGTVRYPRIVPADDALTEQLSRRTLTNLYNERPTWLDLAHKRLDEAVFAAYGWPANLTDDDLLTRLLALNRERAAAQ